MTSSKRFFAKLVGKKVKQELVIEEVRNETEIGLDDFIAEFVLGNEINKDDLDIEEYGAKIVLGDHDYLIEEIISPTIIKVRFLKPDFIAHTYIIKK